MTLHWIYIGVSWLLLLWHDLWSSVFGEGFESLGTDWAWVLSIVGVVITLRVVLFPLFVKQIRSQRAMQKLAPEIKALQERYKGDRETLQREMMELYRKEKANPLMGCLPILLQAPVFLGLFWVLRRPDPHQTLRTDEYFWTGINDGKYSDWNSYIDASLFGAPFWGNFSSPAADLEKVGASQMNVWIVTAILVVLMILTTFLTTRQMILKTGWSEDPNQRMIQKVMLYGIPVIMLFSGAIMPVGVMIYWTINNLFSLAQQQYVLRKYPPPQQNSANKPPKPGSKAHDQMVAEQEEAEERRKALAPKPGQKPKSAKVSQSSAPQNKSGGSAPSNNARQGGPGSGKNLSRSERIARAKKVSGAQQGGKKKKGNGGGSRAA